MKSDDQWQRSERLVGGVDRREAMMKNNSCSSTVVLISEHGEVNGTIVVRWRGE